MATQQDLLQAARKGDVELITRYLDDGGDVNVELKGQNGDHQSITTLLHVAARKGHTELVALLLSKGASLEKQNGDRETPLVGCLDPWAWQHSDSKLNLDVVRLLVEAGASVNMGRATGLCPLHAVCALALARAEDVEKQKAVIFLLLMRGADLYASDGANWRTPFFYARNPAIGAFLLDECWVDIGSLRDRYGYTPLFTTRRKDMAEFMISRGFSVHARDELGQTPLFCHAHSPDIAELLLQKGADINAQDDGGWRPIQRAIELSIDSQFPYLALLLHWGADLGGVMPARSLWRDQSVEAVLAKRLAERVRALRAEQKPLEPPVAWLKWLVNSPVAAPALAAALESPAPAPSASGDEKIKAPLLTRDEMVQPLKNYAWEKRKHLICCYFETRRRRKEAASANAAAGVGAAGSNASDAK